MSHSKACSRPSPVCALQATVRTWRLPMLPSSNTCMGQHSIRMSGIKMSGRWVKAGAAWLPAADASSRWQRSPALASGERHLPVTAGRGGVAANSRC